jgi:precorrin-8X/cobalt-precorrin-8 methylmutase
MVGAQPCWKLAYTGSVGSQSLTGIPVIRKLRDHAAWAEHARIWPFETGLRPPNDDTRVVFAEVWPSWWRKQIKAEYGPPNDQAQVRSVAGIFAEAVRANELAGWFCGDPSLSNEQRVQVETEEAWTLGVTAPRRPQRSAPPVQESQEGEALSRYTYLRDPTAIYRSSFALVRAETDLSRFPAAMRSLAVRLAHAAGDTAILADLAWSRGAVGAGRRALAAGAPILVDSTMLAAGIIGNRLPAQNTILCLPNDPATTRVAAQLSTTRSAAAVELWRPHLDGAVVAIGNAPTALFHLLEVLAAGAPRPSIILGFPVGFVGAADAKAALTEFGRGIPYIALTGRRGGSALAAAAINALAAPGRTS